MALSIGELAGYLTLDDSQFEKGLDGAKGKFEGLGGWLKDNGKKIGMAAGAAVGAAVAAGVAANIDIAAGNDKLAAQLGLNSKEAGKAGKIAGNLYRGAWGESMEEVNEALRHVMQNVDGMSKASSKDLEGITAAVLDVTTAFDQDLGMTTAAVGQMMRTGMAKDATEALDIITLGLQSPANKADDLMETMNEYGTQFRKLGLSGAEAMGLLSQGIKGGARDADVVADAFKEFSIRTQENLFKLEADGSTSLTDLGMAFQAAGLKSHDEMWKVQEAIAGGGKGAREALELLVGGVQSIDAPLERTRAYVAMFGTQAEDMGGALDNIDFDTAASGLGKVEGAAAEMGATLNDNFKTKMTEWKRSAEGFVQDALMAMVPALESGAEKAKDFGHWVGENEKPIKIVGGVLATILIPLLIAAGVQATISATKQAAAWVMTQAGAIKTGVVMTATSALMVGKWVFMSVQALLHAGRIAAAWLISMGPIGLVIAAVVGLVVVIVKNWEKIKEVVAAGWNWVREKSVATWEVVKEATRSATLWVLDKALWFAEKMLGAMAKAFGWAPGIGEKLKAAHEKVKTFRENVNAELGGIKDQEVWINVGVRAPGADPAGNVGRNKDLVNALKPGGGKGGAGAIGGSGIIPRVNASTAGTRGIATDVQGDVAKAADAIQKTLTEKLATQLGPMGAVGRVLPAGSYSIGMPYMGYPGHYGADYPAAQGTPVYSPWPGRITAAYDIPGSNPYNSTPYASYGRVVKISHSNGMSSLFAHLSDRVSGLGPVAAGSMIGRVGTTGNSTGNHLHYESRRNGTLVNPATLGLFDTGGLARNAGLMVKGPMPERVLNERQTEAFEAALDRNFGGADELLAEVRALRIVVDRLPDEFEQNRRTR